MMKKEVYRKYMVIKGGAVVLGWEYMEALLCLQNGPVLWCVGFLMGIAFLIESVCVWGWRILDFGKDLALAFLK